MEVLNEWSVNAPWGKIALVSWGNPSGEPVLMVHGRQDSLATFTMLLELMPNTYHYVGMDLPGHGRSDPFPTGIMLTRFHFITAIDEVVKSMGWTQFIFMAHSMGGELGLFYHAIRPNRIKKLILLDTGVALLSITAGSMAKLCKGYEQYYDNYKNEQYEERIYSKSKAIESVMNARGFTEEQAEIILSRNLTAVGVDQYRLSWHRKLKNLAYYFMPLEYSVQLFSNLPPTLFIAASQTIKLYKNSSAEKLIDELKKQRYFIHKVVEGSHDVHFTNPERLIGLIGDFLGKESVRSKL